MKGVSSLRNGNPAAPPSPHPSSLPVVLCAAGGAALHAGGRSPSLHSNLKWTLLAPLSSPFHAGRRWWKILIIHIKCCPLRHCIFPELADFQHVFFSTAFYCSHTLINASALLAVAPPRAAATHLKAKEMRMHRELVGYSISLKTLCKDFMHLQVTLSWMHLIGPQFIAHKLSQFM